MIQAATEPRPTTAAPIDPQALNRDIARGVLSLCDAITHLGKVRDAMPANPRMLKVMKNLIDAAAEVPDESWGVLFLLNNVGYDEIVHRFRETVLREVQP